MPVIIIAEKPSVAADIASVLGVKSKQDTHWQSDEIWVTWAAGGKTLIYVPGAVRHESLRRFCLIV